MQFAGKTLTEYFRTSRRFLVIIFIGQVISVIWRLSYGDSSELQTLLLLAVVVVTGWAGWVAVRDHGFSLRQAAVVGFLLSLATYWALPIFHSPREGLLLAVFNSIIYIVLATLGGLLAKGFGRRGLRPSR